MSKRWVCFFQNMINLNIFSLDQKEKAKSLSLSKLILATQLPPVIGSTEISTQADSLSQNSDSEPIITLSKHGDSSRLLQDLSTSNAVIQEEDEENENETSDGCSHQTISTIGDATSQFSRIKAVSKPQQTESSKQADIMWSKPVNEIISFVESDNSMTSKQQTSTKQKEVQKESNKHSLQSLKMQLKH